ncbi:MAG: hypothetical protein WCO89_08780 [Syntrophus sp. (in: bacteria)]
MLLMAVPRVRDALLNDSLKSAARHVIGAARELRYDAAREQVDYVLHLDLNNRTLWTYSADMTPEKKEQRKEDAYRFPEGVMILDVYRWEGNSEGRRDGRLAGNSAGLPEGGKQNEGEAAITFFKKGYTEPTVIHLARGERVFTLVFQPFLSSVKVYEEYVDFVF